MTDSTLAGASGAPAATGADPDAGVAGHPAVRRVRDALDAAGATGRVVVLGEHARTAGAAAEQLGVEAAQIANSLVFALPAGTEGADGPSPLLVMTSGAHRVDTAKVAALLGVERLLRADADFVRQHTGFAIGGVAPVGHLVVPRTLVDVTLARHDEVWAAAGHPRTVFRTTFDQLVRITGGTPAEVA